MKLSYLLEISNAGLLTSNSIEDLINQEIEEARISLMRDAKFMGLINGPND